MTEFVNIDKSATESLIAVFMMHLRDSSQQLGPANGIQPNSPPDTSVTSDDDSSSEPKVLQMSSPRNKCCVCGKLESSKRVLRDRESCSHRCCAGCRSKHCNKCSSLPPAIVRPRNIVEPLISSSIDSSRVHNSPMDTSDVAASPSRQRSNSICFSKTATATTDSGKAKSDSSKSKSKSENRDESDHADDEFTPKPARRRSSSLTRDDRGRHSEKCVICMDTMTNPKKLECGHMFCAECIEAAFAHAAKCPCCGRIFGKLKGSQPTGGSMKVQRSKDDLAGYRGVGSFVIKYEIPSGFQQVACDLFSRSNHVLQLHFSYTSCFSYAPFHSVKGTLFQAFNCANS